ncbi:hypothetical protein LJC59_04375 [Desulfovibrio sp. OttesenSCG-928-A18]|nr:hypothetical protein [Desulfovibrio sp. OttesenSCG-928-A18]
MPRALMVYPFFFDSMFFLGMAGSLLFLAILARKTPAPGQKKLGLYCFFMMLILAAIHFYSLDILRNFAAEVTQTRQGEVFLCLAAACVYAVLVSWILCPIIFSFKMPFMRECSGKELRSATTVSSLLGASTAFLIKGALPFIPYLRG